MPSQGKRTRHNPQSLDNIYNKVSSGRDISSSDLTNNGTPCQGKAPSKALQDAANSGRATNSATTIYEQDSFNWVDFADEMYGLYGNVKSVAKNGTNAYNSAKTILKSPVSGITKTAYSGYKTAMSTISGWTKLDRYF